ncbi:MAG: SMC-Scp complex subunit ScpB [Planctomycetota bacterium]
MSDDPVDADESEDEFLLDDLGAAYARAAAKHAPDEYVEPATEPSQAAEETGNATIGLPNLEPEDSVHPAGIIEAALFVGHPENEVLSAAMLASLMRDVTEDEVVEHIDSLNDSYRRAGQALRIVSEETGYKMAIAPAVENVRQSFLGKVREARLSQAAIEVLALVAYQPGVTTQTIQDQRGRESGALLNQLVRRRLIEMRREKPKDAGGENSGRKVAHYYPSERFFALFGLESLEDLPLVDEGFFQG